MFPLHGEGPVTGKAIGLGELPRLGMSLPGFSTGGGRDLRLRLMNGPGSYQFFASCEHNLEAPRRGKAP